MMMFFKVYFVLSLLFLVACSQNKEIEKKPIARAYDAYLYDNDLANVTNNSSQKDSADIAQRYVDAWIKKQILFKEAEKNSSIDKIELEKRVQEYRYQLLIFDFQKKYSQEKLDTVVTDAELREYYTSHSKDFELKQNIVKGIFLKVDQKASQLPKVMQWIRSSNENDWQELKSFAFTYAAEKHISDSTWTDFDKLLDGTPFATSPNKLQLLKQSQLLQTTDENFVYLLKIVDYKIADQTSPFDYVKERIRDIIINKRKIDLQVALEERLFRDAKDKKDFEILK